VKGFRKLRVPDPESAPGMKTLLAAARRVVKEVGDKYYIQANIDCGPFSLAAVLRGAQQFMLDLVTEPERDLHELLDFCTEVVIAYGQAMIATGVHGIQYGDSTASLISPDQYREFVLPYEIEIAEKIRKNGALSLLHICGNVINALPDIAKCSADGFDLDYPVDLAEAFEMLLPDVAVKGNINPRLFMKGFSEELKQSCLQAKDIAADRIGYIMSTGCLVPRDSATESFHIMADVCRYE